MKFSKISNNSGINSQSSHSVSVLSTDWNGTFFSYVRYGTTRSDLMINSEGDCYGKISQKNFVVCSITNVPLPFNFEILEFANGFRPPPNLLIFENIYGFRLKNSLLVNNNDQMSILSLKYPLFDKKYPIYFRNFYMVFAKNTFRA